MNPDGSDPLQVSGQQIWGPFSADGTMMVHANTPGSVADFTVWSAAGTKVSDVTVPDDGYQPSWTPDGRIAYSAARTVCDPDFCDVQQLGIWVVNLDGSGNTKVTDDGILPAFSPDGTKLAFLAQNSAGSSSIYVANSNGSNRVPVASGVVADDNNRPEWSPDSRRIGFVRINCVARGDCRWDLWSVAADGTDERQLTVTANQERTLAWSPDGSKIAVSVSDPSLSASAGIFTLNAADGSGLTQLRTDGGVIFWQPIPQSYARPKGATPLRVPLVPAFNQCT